MAQNFAGGSKPRLKNSRIFASVKNLENIIFVSTIL